MSTAVLPLPTSNNTSAFDSIVESLAERQLSSSSYSPTRTYDSSSTSESSASSDASLNVSTVRNATKVNAVPDATDANALTATITNSGPNTDLKVSTKPKNNDGANITSETFDGKDAKLSTKNETSETNPESEIIANDNKDDKKNDGNTMPDIPSSKNDQTLINNESCTAIVISNIQSSSTSISTQEPLIPHKGLNNLGNTCYLNSALQMLFSIDSFVSILIQEYLVDEEAEEEEQKGKMEEHTFTTNNKITKNRKEAYQLHYALAKLFNSMRVIPTNINSTIENEANQKQELDVTTAVRSTGTSINTSKLNNDHETEQLIRELKAVIDQLSPQFRGYYQQDSHEFLSTLLDLLHDEIIDFEKEKLKKTEPVKAESGNNSKDMKDSDEDIDMEKNNANNTTSEVNKEEESKQDDCTSLNKENIPNDTPKTVTEEAASAISETEESTDVTVQTVASNVIEKDGYVIVNLSAGAMSNATSSDHGDVSCNKKARLTHSKDIDETTVNDNDNDNTDIPMDSKEEGSTIAKVPSFSQLKLDGISNLLHGSPGKEVAHEKKKDEKSLSTSQHQSDGIAKKLIGGRISLDSVTAAISSSLSSQIELRVPSNSHDRLDPIQQEDALTELEDMDELQEINHDDEALQPQNEETDAIMTEETSEKEKHSPTIVDKFFTMEVRSCFTCDSCSYTRSHMETYRHLSIDIGDDNDTNGLSIQSSISSISQSQYERTVQEGLRKFFKNEKLECKCEKCFGESATLAKEIVRLPKVLLLHFKRFIVDISPDYTSISYRKNRSAVEFSETLDMDEEDESGALGEFLANDVRYPEMSDGKIFNGGKLESPSTDSSVADYEIVESVEEDNIDEGEFIDLAIMKRKYNLRSVVNHIGGKANCGHYKANALRLKQYDENEDSQNERDWFQFNDNTVSKLNNEVAMGDRAQRDAYMILYEFE